MAFLILFILILTPVLALFNLFTLIYCVFQRKISFTMAANVVALPILLFYSVAYLVDWVRGEPAWTFGEQAFLAASGSVFLCMIGLLFYLLPKLGK